jgi:hypothetical protein
MKRMTIKKYGLVTLICAVCCLNFISTSYGEEVIPQPGTVIDKSNYMQYKHLFPEEFLPAFTDVWGLGLEPYSITVGEPTPALYLKAAREADEKNRGKYELDAEGYVNAPTETIVGQPFYGVDPSDPDYAQKVMWNYYFKYLCDSNHEIFTQLAIRKGESTLGVDMIQGYNSYFTSRFVLDPKPYYANTNNLRTGMLLFLLYPPVQKNLINLMWTHLDQRLEDTGYVYVPAFRRVLRTESSERSTPINNSVQAPDDFNIFSGRVPEFNYKVIGDKTVLAVRNSGLRGNYTIAELKTFKTFPFDKEGWEPIKMLVIDITPKNPAYPQSRKRIYIDKETLDAQYGIAWDRAGVLWKIWQNSHKPHPMPDAERQHSMMYYCFGIDIQMGYATIMLRGANNYNDKAFAEGDYTPSAVRGLAQ